MADKMMRVATRNTEGHAKPLKSDKDGGLVTSRSLESKRLNSTNITILPDEDYFINDVHAFASFTLQGRISTNQTKLDIGVVSYLAEDAPIPQRVSFPINDRNRFITSVYNASSDRVRIRIRNTSAETMVVTHLYMVTTNQSDQSLSVEDLEGNDISLSAVKDDEGKGVLRVVDAAPHGYDEENNVFRVVQLEKDKEPQIQTPHKTTELVWSDSSLTGSQILKVNLSGNRGFLQGEKGFIFYQGIEDNHDIYFNYRIGGSGSYLREFIVEGGSGANGSNNKKIMIPEECFPIMDFSNSSSGSSTSELVFESTSGDLSNLRAFIVVM